MQVCQHPLCLRNKDFWGLMANLQKTKVLEILRQRFGEVRQVKGSRSLFVVGNEAARIYCLVFYFPRLGFLSGKLFQPRLGR